MFYLFLKFGYIPDSLMQQFIELITWTTISGPFSLWHFQTILSKPSNWWLYIKTDCKKSTQNLLLVTYYRQMIRCSILLIFMWCIDLFWNNKNCSRKHGITFFSELFCNIINWVQGCTANYSSCFYQTHKNISFPAAT